MRNLFKLILCISVLIRNKVTRFGGGDGVFKVNYKIVKLMAMHA